MGYLIIHTNPSSIISSLIATPESFELAKEMLAEGKRDLLVHAIPDAVSNCSKACEIMVKLKGEMAPECAEAYFYYGKALLELSRVESGVLGNALDGVDMETKTSDVKDTLVEDTEAMTTDEKSEIEEMWLMLSRRTLRSMILLQEPTLATTPRRRLRRTR